MIFIWLLLFSNGLCEAIDLCIFLGTCGQNQNNNNARNDNIAIPEFVEVETDWVQPQEANHNHIYHFAKDAPAMNWYDADEYCVGKGGFLVEPLTSQENDFIKGYAQKFPNVNWWTGLREAEDCKCQATDARSVEFDANIDYNTLTDRNKNGYVKTTCPSFGNYRKTCGEKVWLWSFSAIRMSFSDWSTESGEPNGDNEHCVCLWSRHSNRWSDWHCNTKNYQEGNFKPLCQKDKEANFDDNDQQTGKDSVDDQKEDLIDESNGDSKNDEEDVDEEDDNGNVLPDSLVCVDDGVTYKSGNRDKLSNIHQVESADLCRQMCAETDGCLYWTWIEKKRRGRKVCRLKSGVISSGFRRQKNKAVSGTMLNGCNPIQTNPTNNDDQQSRTENCIEFKAVYVNGDQFSTINNINNVKECRNRCLGTAGCQFFTFRKVRRGRQKRCELRTNANFETKFHRRSTSGSVMGNCRTANIDEMSQCSCLDVDPLRPGRGSNEEISLTDLLGGAIDGRISFGGSEDDEDPDVSPRANACGQNQVNRCGLVKISEPTTTTTTTTVRPQRGQKGEYCVDYDINYLEGDEFKKLRNIESAEECRQKCVQENQCKFYVWRGNSRRKQCLLKSSSLWVPRYEEGTVSGSIEGLCRDQRLDEYGFCDCVELAPDYYDEDFIDLIETGLINERSNTCPPDQGRRCYSLEPIAIPDSNPTSSRIFFG